MLRAKKHWTPLTSTVWKKSIFEVYSFIAPQKKVSHKFGMADLKIQSST